jgi:hypothetical protein
MCVRRADIRHPPACAGATVAHDIPKPKGKPLPSEEEIRADLERIAKGTGSAAEKARATLATMKKSAR